MSGILFRAVFAASLAMPVLAIAQSDKPIGFEGQTINLIVPTSAGGGSDFQGRLVARHIGKHLPGNPDIVVQNIDGGGGVKGATYFLEINPEIDLTIAMISSSLPFRVRSGQVADTVFDPRKMQWIGSASDSTNYCAFGTATYKDLEELKEKEVTLGATSKTATDYAITRIVAETLDWKAKIVTGYENSSTRALAVERGEIDGVCGSMSSYANSTGPVVDQGIAKLAFYFGPHRQDDIAAPYLLDLPMPEEKREFAEIALSGTSFGRPYTLHPDADPRLLPIFRQAFEATVADPEFLAEAKKADVPIRYTSGEDIEQNTTKLYQTSDDVISKIEAAIYE